MANLTTLISFSGYNGNSPDGSLVSDASGNLFGTTLGGGDNGYGTVFEIAYTGGAYATQATVLVSFNVSNGASPKGLGIDGNGNLLGTTSGEGTSSYGTVFEIVDRGGTYDSTPTTLASFTGTDGSAPEANLIADANGDLFGTTSDSSSGGGGTVFEIPFTPTGYGARIVLTTFNGTDGSHPDGSLLADGSGNLFGTTYSGGPGNGGTVFELAKTANGYAATPTILASFSGPNGANPAGGLIADANGNLFGTTAGNGSDNKGTIFEIANTGSGYAAATTLVTFTGSNGAYPLGSLLMDASGNLFGTTSGGGTANDGTVFELANTGTTTAPSYASDVSTVISFNGANGKSPSGSLSVDSAGNMFGTTYAGGAHNYGTVFELSNTSYDVACFCRGTRILTDQGEIPVESLVIGNRVITHTGQPEPIRWIGRRAYAARFLAGRPELHPILFRAGALGNGLPRQDLRVSPRHAMFLAGHLVPAAALVNGTTILRDQATTTVEYYHVELARHDILFAEGAPSETFLDDGSREVFHNAAEYDRLYPHLRQATPRYCAPHLTQGPLLETIRRRLSRPQAA